MFQKLLSLAKLLTPDILTILLICYAPVDILRKDFFVMIRAILKTYSKGLLEFGAVFK